MDTREAAPGDTLQVRYGGGQYVVAGFGSASGSIALAFFGLFIGAGALPVAASGISPRRGTPLQNIFEALRWKWIARLTKWLAATSLVGIAVFAYLAWIF
ncbi:hypothetical protein AB0D04_06210 [Streptomyces sp. NPDC048483]|uniref:hypothetical protein n=1 Tax=Streptomyces sp. NPDC048483 TaxID=3154927 RepID=UPI003438560C